MTTESFTNGLNFLLSVGTVISQIAAVFLLVLYFLRGKGERFGRASNFVGKYGLFVSFMIFLFASVTSLLYSEVLGFRPCSLCWLQRTLMYPQVFLLWLALYKKDRGIAVYSIFLSVIGAVIALYQHYLQMGGGEIIPCLANSESVSCAVRDFFEFGYITYPLMSFTGFLLVIALMLHVRGWGEKQEEWEE